MMSNKSKIEEFAEVFTNQNEVSSMLDLVKNEVDRIDSTFLEPACGDGNFLCEILNRKINNIIHKYEGSSFEIEKYSFLALTSLHGIDIQNENVLKTRENLFNLFVEKISSVNTINPNLEKSALVVLSHNIICANPITLKIDGENENIIFTQWNFIDEINIVRREFKISHLIAYAPFEEGSLFSDLGEDVFIPEPVKDYKPTNFLELHNGV